MRYLPRRRPSGRRGGPSASRAEASYARRLETLRDHERYQKRWLYFIANDPRVPKVVQEKMQTWGLPKDEFKDNGGWKAPPADWGDPENALTRRQFFDVMEICLEKLPPNTARVFMMREVMELESDEICKELTITANNLWVILYRARMALRQCLEQNWFAGQGSG